MDKDTLFARLTDAIIDGSKDKAEALAREVVALNIDPIEAIEGTGGIASSPLRTPFACEVEDT